ncbi:MAG: TonB-dependent receptor domain-containing protein, partial [Chitinophagales bacterium]
MERLQLGNINETNIGGYLGATIDIKKWTFNPSIRLDYFDFQYNDKLTPTYKTQEKSEVIVSPKFNILFNPTNNFQIYLKTGKGFHSNDTRVVLADKSKTTLPAAYGYDLGYIWKPTPKMLLNMTYWSLYLEQEFVYVGDAGIVEPSGKTSRQGIDLSYRYQPLTWLNWRFDANYTHARAISEPNGKDYIPLAPDFTLASGLDLQFKSGLYANINVRHLANRPANEDYSIVAKGYTIANLNTGYKWRDLNFGIQI